MEFEVSEEHLVAGPDDGDVLGHVCGKEACFDIVVGLIVVLDYFLLVLVVMIECEGFGVNLTVLIGYEVHEVERVHKIELRGFLSKSFLGKCIEVFLIVNQDLAVLGAN